jgi:hypothetical protein
VDRRSLFSWGPEFMARVPRLLVHLPRNSYTMAKPFKWAYAGKSLTA